MEYFQGNKDIVIIQKLAERGFYGQLKGHIIFTNEADIELSTLYDYDSIKTVEEDFTTNSIVAPKLIMHLKAFFTQRDENGNIIRPQYVYFFGSTKTGTALTDDFEVALSDKDRFIYGISYTFFLDDILNWAVSYPKSNMHWFEKDNNNPLLISQQAKNIRVFYSKELEGKNSMEAAQVLWRSTFAGVKWKELTGATPDNLTDGEIVELDEKGLAAYRVVNGAGEVSNSLQTDGSTHLDTTFILDTIKYNIAMNMHKMFKENIINSTNVRSAIDRYSKRALNWCGNLGMIEQKEDMTYKHVTQIPQITAQVRETRDLKGIIWKFIPNVPIERIEGVVEEVLDEVYLTVSDIENIEF